MPKLTNNPYYDELLDSSGPMPKRGCPKELSFEAYGFVGINKAHWPKEVDYPDIIVNFMKLDSICSSVGGVQTWVKHNCPKQSGTIVKVRVSVLEALSVVKP